MGRGMSGMRDIVIDNRRGYPIRHKSDDFPPLMNIRFCLRDKCFLLYFNTGRGSGRERETNLMDETNAHYYKL